jgi:hypothetical protein
MCVNTMCVCFRPTILLLLRDLFVPLGSDCQLELPSLLLPSATSYDNVYTSDKLKLPLAKGSAHDLCDWHAFTENPQFLRYFVHNVSATVSYGKGRPFYCCFISLPTYCSPNTFLHYWLEPVSKHFIVRSVVIWCTWQINFDLINSIFILFN